MKLVYPDIKSVFYFNYDEFPSLIIENPSLFYRFVTDLKQQSRGEEGHAVLSNNDIIVPFIGNFDILTDFFPFEINRKPILTKITAALEKQALSPENYEKTQQLIGRIERLIYELAFQNDLDLELPKLTISSLLKSSGICLKEEYPSLAEKILDYMELMTEYNLAKIFLLVNIRSLLSKKTMELFTENCRMKNFMIMLLDNHEYPVLPGEHRTIIDEDFCEI